MIMDSRFSKPALDCARKILGLDLTVDQWVEEIRNNKRTIEDIPYRSAMYNEVSARISKNFYKYQ